VRALIAVSLACVFEFCVHGGDDLMGVQAGCRHLGRGHCGTLRLGLLAAPGCSLDEWMGSRTLKGISGLATIAALFQLPACASSSSIPLKSAARLLLRASGSQNPGLQSRCQYAGSLSGVLRCRGHRARAEETLLPANDRGAAGIRFHPRIRAAETLQCRSDSLSVRGPD